LFLVENVKVNTKLLSTCPSIEDAIVREFKLTAEKVQSTSTCPRPLLEGDFRVNGAFYRAIHLAFIWHYPLVLSPDIIWLVITQGLATHINQHSEELRSHFVSFDGKKDIIVRRDDFVLGNKTNDWGGCIAEFSTQIKENIGEETHKLIVGDFTTTGPTERIASEIVLMDSMKAYFSYTVYTRCGIPSITLNGTVDDWKKIYSRVGQFRKFGLNAWTDALEAILKQFVRAAEGKPDISFWRNIYKWEGAHGSGAPHITGWMINLYPYLWQWGELLENKEFPKHGPTKADPDSPPNSISKCPVKWVYLGNPIPMHFYAGFAGVSQDPSTKALRPEIGWAVSLD